MAEQLSKRMGVTLSDAVIYALEAELRKTGQPINRERVDALCNRLAALPDLDDRAAEVILAYDEFGIPR